MRKQINDDFITGTEFEADQELIAEKGVTEEDTLTLEGLADNGDGPVIVEAGIQELCSPSGGCESTRGIGDLGGGLSTPYNLIADNISQPDSPTQGSVYLAWETGPNPGEEYYIYRADIAGINRCSQGSYELVGVTSGTEFTDSTPSAESIYGYRVQAVSLGGRVKSELSDCVGVLVSFREFVPPGDLYVENNSDGVNHLADLDWSGPTLSGNYMYQVYRQVKASAPGLLPCKDFTETPEIFDSLESAYRDIAFTDPNPLVSYRVRYYHVPSETEFPLSDCVVTHVDVCTTNPPTPAALDGTYDEFTHMVYLDWDPVSCSGCSIEYWVYKGMPFNPERVFYEATTSTDYTVPIYIPENEGATFSIVAVDQNTGCRSGAQSVIVEGGTHNPPGPPDAPSEIFGFYDGTDVVLTWTYVPDTTYKVFRAQGGCGTSYSFLASSTDNIHHDPISAGGTYSYVVRAIAADQTESEDSPCFEIAIEAPLTSVPGYLAAEVEANVVQLTWTGVTGAEGYYVYRYGSACPGTPNQGNRIGFTRGDSFISSLYPGTTAYYHVTAVDEYGRETDPSTCESATAEPMSWNYPGALPMVKYYMMDHLGTTRLVLDAYGVLQSQHDYEPYGMEMPPTYNPSGNKYQFTGHERDQDSGLDYMHFRYYGASLGRFMKPDNIGGNPANPQSWNLYSYVNGNPVNMNDPTGHMGAIPFRGNAGYCSRGNVYINGVEMSRNIDVSSEGGGGTSMQSHVNAITNYD